MSSRSAVGDDMKLPEAESNRKLMSRSVRTEELTHGRRSY